MPKVRPLIAEQQIEYEWSKISEAIYLDCKRLGIKNKDLAEVIGVTPEAISHQFSNRRVQMPTRIAYEKLREKKLNNEKIG